MFCKKCGSEVDDQENFCPVCRTPLAETTDNGTVNIPKAAETENAETSNSEMPIEETVESEATNSVSQNGSVGGMIKTAVEFVKNKLNFRSVFDDTVARTHTEKSLSSKYLALTLITLTLIIFWLSNIIKISFPEIRELSIDKISFSMGDIFSGASTIFLDLGLDDLFSEFKELTLGVTIVGAMFEIATFLIIISPIFAFIPLLQRSVTKKYWAVIERICITLSCFTYLGFFFIMKFVIFAMSETIETDVKLSFNFGGIVFVGLFIAAFVIIHLINRDVKKVNFISDYTKEEGTEH